MFVKWCILLPKFVKTIYTIILIIEERRFSIKPDVQLWVNLDSNQK